VGVYFEKGGWNGVTGDMMKAGSTGAFVRWGIRNAFRTRTPQVAQVGGDAIYIFQGTEDDISLNARCSGGGGGVYIEGGRNNRASGGISDCDGFVIHGGVGNTVGGSYQGPSDPAVILEDTVLSNAAVEVIGSHGVGGVLEGDVTYSGLNVYGCGMTTGVESSGAQQHHNRLQFNSAGCASGPSQYGIKVDNGSHHNILLGVIHKAGGDGIYISGGVHDTVIKADATGNHGHGIYLGNTSNTVIRGVRVNDNGQDGIHISSQASDTTVTGAQAGGYVSAEGNGGNGITVLGVGATVKDVYAGRNSTGLNPIPNQGSGIFVDSVPSFTARNVSMGANCLGGLIIGNVTQTSAPGQAAPVLVDVQDIRVEGEPLPGCLGYGVGFFNVSDVRAQNVKVSGYNRGVGVENGARITFDDVSSHDNEQEGFELINVQDAEFHIRSLSNGGKGIALDGGKNITMGEDTDQIMLTFYANDNGSTGLDIANSQNVAAVWGQFKRNGGPGIAIEGSEKVAIFHPQAEDNQAPGISILESSGVDIASGFKMEMPTMIQRNDEAGVTIYNAQDVTFSSGWRALHPHWPRPTVGFNRGPGILIGGEESNGITIAGWTMQGNEGAGIEIENGPSNVLIGDFEGGYANLITENAEGILAQGADTDIVIANNHIWRQVPPSSGQSDPSSAKDATGAGPTQQGLELSGAGISLYDGLQEAIVSGNFVEANADMGIWLGESQLRAG